MDIGKTHHAEVEAKAESIAMCLAKKFKKSGDPGNTEPISPSNVPSVTAI